MQKAPILRKKLSMEAAHQGKLIIGILGTHKGAGVTHLGLLLAHYFSEWQGLKTAYVECYPQQDIQYLQYFLNGRISDSDGINSFEHHRVTYHMNVKTQGIAEIVGDEYECVVLDLGVDFSSAKNEFIRCDKRIVVSSLSVLKKHELEKFIQNTDYIKYSNQWTYGIPFVQQKDIRQASKEFQREIHGIPYEPKLFALSANTIQLLQDLMY